MGTCKFCPKVYKIGNVKHSVNETRPSTGQFEQLTDVPVPLNGCTSKWRGPWTNMPKVPAMLPAASSVFRYLLLHFTAPLLSLNTLLHWLQGCCLCRPAYNSENVLLLSLLVKSATQVYRGWTIIPASPMYALRHWLLILSCLEQSEDWIIYAILWFWGTSWN